MSATLRLKTHGAWPSRWTAATLTDPRDLYGTRAHIGTTWPRIGHNYYTGAARWGDRWHLITECGDELCVTRGPSPAEQEVAAVKTALADRPGDFFRAWGWITDDAGLVGLGGVSLGPYGKAGYQLGRITAASPEAAWTRDSTSPTGLAGISLSGASMALVRAPDGSLLYFPAFVSLWNGTTGFARAVSTDRGRTWVADRDSAGRLVDRRPLALRKTSLVFQRALVIGGRVHLWATVWRKNWVAGVYHLVSEDGGVEFRNYYAGATTKEFGTQVGKGIIPWADGDALYAVAPAGLGYTARFGGHV